MGRFVKYLPWAIALGCAVALVFAWLNPWLQLEQKNVELSASKLQYDNLVTETNGKLAEANRKLDLANRPEVQVRVEFKKPYLGSARGNVVNILNLAKQTVAITLDLERASSGQKQHFDMVIDAGKSQDVGEREGWTFVPGDKLTVARPGHKSIVLVTE